MAPTPMYAYVRNAPSQGHIKNPSFFILLQVCQTYRRRIQVRKHTTYQANRRTLTVERNLCRVFFFFFCVCVCCCDVQMSCLNLEVYITYVQNKKRKETNAIRGAQMVFFSWGGNFFTLARRLKFFFAAPGKLLIAPHVFACYLGR